MNLKINNKYIVSIEFSLSDADSVLGLRKFFDLDDFGSLMPINPTGNWKGVYFEIYENSLTIGIRKYNSWLSKGFFLKNYDILKLILFIRRLNPDLIKICFNNIKTAEKDLTVDYNGSTWGVSTKGIETRLFDRESSHTKRVIYDTMYEALEGT